MFSVFAANHAHAETGDGASEEPRAEENASWTSDEPVVLPTASICAAARPGFASGWASVHATRSTRPSYR